MFNSLQINQDISKNVLNSIIENKKVNKKNLIIKKYLKQIENLRLEYQNFNFNERKQDFKYQKFWLLAKKKYGPNFFKEVKRNQGRNKNKFNIIFSEFNLSLGFTPSLLTLLIFSKEVKDALKYNDFYRDFLQAGGIDHSSNEQKLILTRCLKKKIQLVTPLCPDYEHVKVAKDLYKYTFNKLNNGIGLIGNRLLKVVQNLYSVLDKYNIQFEHYVFYGDFEGYSNMICKRLKENEKSFIKKVNLSRVEIKKNSQKILTSHSSQFHTGLVVKNLLNNNKKKWFQLLNKNKRLLRNTYKNDLLFRKKILEIVKSRKMLYSSWFPNMIEKEYVNLVLDQGSEYLLMGKLFKKKFSNPIVLGFDHPKMAMFYGIKDPVPILYGRPHYE